MITQSNLVRRSGYISRIMALPLLFVLVSAFAVKLVHKPSTIPPAHYAAKSITVVIDAGHGGIYPGGASSGGIKEKDINLLLSKKISELASLYNINVILTRSSDATVGNVVDLKSDLLNRVKIINEARADLFISIHTNSGMQSTTSTSGFEAYISKKKNDQQSRLLASTILTGLKSIYPVLETIQQREVGVTVLDQAICPSVLLECGYITTPADLAFITNPANQEKVARKILEGIVQYSNAQTVTAASLIISEGAQKERVANIAPADQIEIKATEVVEVKLFETDTISAEELSRLNPDDIKSLTVDMPKNRVLVYLKNGTTKYAIAKQVNDYYTAKHSDLEFKGARLNMNIKDSLVDVIFTKDTVPGSGKGKNIIFTKVEFEPDYPGGQQGWISYLTSHLHYPDAAVKKNIQGTVVMQFIVNTDGKITDVKAISGPEALKAESIRTIRQSGTWVPAKQNGINVRAYKRQPITYKLA
jgi:TonB family protein